MTSRSGLVSIFQRNIWFLTALIVAIAGVAASTSNALLIDEVIYIDMARAMAEQGAFAIAGDGGVDGSPALTKQLTLDVDGLAIPQYPSGYAVIAAPFYALLGVRGLVLLNALSAIVALFLTHRIAVLLYRDRALATLAVAFLAGASFLSAYAFAIWPHVLSLALLLAGVERLLHGTNGPSPDLKSIMVAGLLFGLAPNIRVDTIMFAAAGLLWLRLFALPSNRKAGLVFLAALLPGLLASTLINLQKFGIATPFTYGLAEGAATVGRYTVLLAAGAVIVAAAFLVDTSRPLARRITGWAVSQKGLVAIGVVAIAAVFLVDVVATYIRSVYILVIDVHARDDATLREGVIRMDNGLLLFWGLHKRALLQSMPYFALALVPAVAFFQGKSVKNHALCLAMAAAPISFYALNAWGGGPAFSMRYFLASVPFLAILCAWTLWPLLSPDASGARTNRRAFAFALAAALAIWPLYASPVIGRQLELGVIGLVGLAGVSLLVLPSNKAMRAGSLIVVGFAVGLSMTNSITDAWMSRETRLARTSYEILHVNAFRPGELVVTPTERRWVRASTNGVNIIHPRWGRFAEAISTYVDAGRCVFVQHPATFADVEGARTDWHALRLRGMEHPSFSAIYAPQSQAETCDHAERFDLVELPNG